MQGLSRMTRSHNTENATTSEKNQDNFISISELLSNISVASLNLENYRKGETSLVPNGVWEMQAADTSNWLP